MKTQVSGDVADLKVGYVLAVLVLSVNVMFNLALLVVIKNREGFFADDPTSEYVFIVLSLLCIIYILFLNKFMPCVYKIEADENEIYITKVDTKFPKTLIEKTIKIPKNSVLNIRPSTLGYNIGYWTDSVFYLELTENTEYGSKIAFLYRKKHFFRNELKELQAKLLKSI